jgi:hypothetical protein
MAKLYTLTQQQKFVKLTQLLLQHGSHDLKHRERWPYHVAHASIYTKYHSHIPGIYQIWTIPEGNMDISGPRKAILPEVLPRALSHSWGQKYQYCTREMSIFFLLHHHCMRNWTKSLFLYRISSSLSMRVYRIMWDYRSFSRPRPPLRCITKSTKSAHVHWVVGKWEPFRNDIALSKWFSWILLRNAMAAAAVKKIYLTIWILTDQYWHATWFYPISCEDSWCSSNKIWCCPHQKLNNMLIAALHLLIYRCCIFTELFYKTISCSYSQ